MKTKLPLNLSALSIPLMLVLTSCATSWITEDMLNPVSVGMSREDFHSKILSARDAAPAISVSIWTGLEPKHGTGPLKPKKEIAIEYESVQYIVEVYDMQTGTYKYRGSQHDAILPVYADFLFIFDTEGLLYWGFFNDMQKEDDQLIQALAPLVVGEYEKQKRIEDETRAKQMQKRGGQP